MENSIGEQLKRAREARGWSIEQASKAVHVRQHYLEALENDQFSALPSKVQGRGFLRLYASLLDLPVEPLLNIWDGKTSSQPGLGSVENLPVGDAQVSGDDLVLSPIDSPSHEEVTPASDLAEEEESVGQEDSQVIFREIGQTLQAQRESLGLSLSEVERYTHLRQHYIQALEKGMMEDLPSPVQGRGMLSNYATFLNLDEDALLLRFAEGLQTRRIERLPKPDPQVLDPAKKRKARQAPSWKRFLTPDLIFGIGLAAIILLFILWTAARIDTQSQTRTEPTPPPIAEILLTPDNLIAASEGTAMPPPQAVTGVTTSIPLPVENGQPEESLPNSTENESRGNNGAIPSSILTATLPPMNNDPLQVYIIVRDRAWMQVIADGTVEYLGRVIPGNAYAFSGENQLELLTGNGAALQIIFNQNDLGMLGLNGEVVGLIFTSNGVMTPTPAFTATPTLTPIATVTPLPSATLPPTATVTPFIPNK